MPFHGLVSVTLLLEMSWLLVCSRSVFPDTCDRGALEAAVARSSIQWIWLVFRAERRRHCVARLEIWPSPVPQVAAPAAAWVVDCPDNLSNSEEVTSKLETEI